MNLNQRDIIELKLERKIGTVSREYYWKRIQKQLRELDKLAIILEQSTLALHVRAGKLIIEIPLLEERMIEMYIDVEDVRTVPFCVIADGKYEPFQQDLILGLARLSKHFIDVGANVGFYSISAVKANPQLFVKSFEPNPIVIQKLLDNIDLNKISSQIEIFECGLGSENSEINKLLVPIFTGSGGGGSLRNLHPNEGPPKQFPIKIRVLDEILIGDTLIVDLIKIDVEGYEKFVLDGCNNTIAKDKPTIVIELLRKWMMPFNTAPQQVVDNLKALGYICFGIQESKLVPIEVIDKLTEETNFIFVHPFKSEHLGWVNSNVPACDS